MKKVLDKGYVILVDTMGSDLSVVNSARVSFNKATETLRDEDQKLIRYLAKNDHTSPFRHATMQFEIYAPLMVARQWWKYIIGSSHQDPFAAWNESSRRYVTEAIEFYIPEETAWRSKPENMKQGSGNNLGMLIGKEASQKLLSQIEEGMKNYDWAIENGIATEQARLFIPSAYGLMVRWYWTASLQGVAHFLNQRTDAHAQFEIRAYAEAVKGYALDKFPIAIEALLENTK
ncbi:FAD-dependent thymidylate synthase [Fusibacter sp. 3D3]|uniref:FAD-dependent thymidylate synthase n=1 Tax=Fusibacter sp. 3D3 TaxID=1048380 RepID=UPI0008533DEF|nr:FAD-dependent thymidylate synthase [Fusibacter sp. 3D3]GAU78763.1 thymidylate synthase thyX [Fusibacter sp. 3D3]